MPPMDAAAREAILDKEVQNYVRRGYRVVSRTPTTAQLVRSKKFSLLIAILTLILGIGVGFVIYLLYYLLLMRDSQVYLTVDTNGRLNRT